MAAELLRRRCVVVRLAVGDITTWGAQAIVVSSNTSLSANGSSGHWRFVQHGGLARSNTNGAIHEAAGSELLAACQRLPAVGSTAKGSGPLFSSSSNGASNCRRCDTGSAVVTPAFGELAHSGCDLVVHVVAPDGLNIHAGGRDDHIQRLSEPLLLRAISSALAAAAGHGARSVALPAVGCVHAAAAVHVCHVI
jgi:O-acetyl-ADP-ribose deacetylase (regulator of RNase III)